MRTQAFISALLLVTAAMAQDPSCTATPVVGYNHHYVCTKDMALAEGPHVRTVQFFLPRFGSNIEVETLITNMTKAERRFIVYTTKIFDDESDPGQTRVAVDVQYYKERLPRKLAKDLVRCRLEVWVK